jgi:protein gp37
LNCYAERFAERFRGTQGHPYEQGFDIKIWPERLKIPLSWKKSRLIFVDSMSDLFNEEIPEEFIYDVFSVMRQADWHQFQLLTKHPKRMIEIARKLSDWPTNVWAGVSVESQAWVWRIDVLKELPAKIKFLSCEPLLGPLNLVLDNLQWIIVGGESGPGARPMNIQ